MAKISYHLDLKKLIHDLRGPKGVAALTEEAMKLSEEMNKLKASLQPQAEAKIKEAKKSLEKLQGRMNSAKTDLHKTITLIKKYGKDLEKNFSMLKKDLTVQKKKSKKVTRKKTTKKTSKKA